ncbi:acetylornithine transaminase [Micrococcoides hystricis]|uniref:Acetylornithine aminotransferase n=2 Tax=Micrococcoides hystricis TaxID=1572761 RepID=A0ABV6P854_9MICC
MNTNPMQTQNPGLTSELATGQSQETLLQRYQDAILGIFGSPSRTLVKGEGSRVWDANGKSYLDLLAGISVNALGHCHPKWVKAIADQASTLGHISNLFTSPTQIALAEKLLGLAQAPEGSKVFFANSGTEANEAAFKLARRHGNADPSGQRRRILALERGFHGRTIGALAMTAKTQYRTPFEPMPAGVEHIPFGDIAALEQHIDETVAAVIMEPIQGEAGVYGLSREYLQKARALTREHGALLIYDEVQSGMGRTGSWFAHQGVEAELGSVQPDAMTLAKGLGAGFPIGAMLTFGTEASELLQPGQHGTTFGGNPLATAAALATISVMEEEQLLSHAKQKGRQTAATLEGLDCVAEVREHGLLIGVDLKPVENSSGIGAAVVAAGLEAGFILNATGPNTLRIAPPLVITEAELDEFCQALPELYAAAQQKG